MTPAATVLRDLDRVIASAEPQQRLGLALALAARQSVLAAELASQPAAASAPEGPVEREHWLCTDEAIALLGGKVSRKSLLRSTHGMKFRKDLNRKNVLWDEAGLRRWILSRKS